MKIGMLWYDNSQESLSAKIDRAAGYYAKKYGHAPNLCFVHPSCGALLHCPDGQSRPAHIEVRTNRSVLPNHLWVGVADPA